MKLFRVKILCCLSILITPVLVAKKLEIWHKIPYAIEIPNSWVAISETQKRIIDIGSSPVTVMCKIAQNPQKTTRIEFCRLGRATLSEGLAMKNAIMQQILGSAVKFDQDPESLTELKPDPKEVWQEVSGQIIGGSEWQRFNSILWFSQEKDHHMKYFVDKAVMAICQMKAQTADCDNLFKRIIR